MYSIYKLIYIVCIYDTYIYVQYHIYYMHRQKYLNLENDGITSNNIRLTVDDNSFKKDQEHLTKNTKEIAKYYLELHKDMINTYHSIYSQILQDLTNSGDDDLTIPKRHTDYPLDIKNRCISSVSNPIISLKLIDNIITKNLDTFIKSIEITKRLYKDIIQSYQRVV
jgi:hypothetical protein